MLNSRDILELETEWKTDKRWSGIERSYTAEDVLRLRGTVKIDYTLAALGARRFWKLLNEMPYVTALGAVTGNQAVQQVQAGLRSIYVSGWQVAGDNNTSGHTYPDQSLYPADSVPRLVRRINNALQRADQIDHMDGGQGPHWFAPIVADAEAGFGGTLNAFELMKAMIEVGAAAVHYEDQLSSAKKCGHMGGKVLVPTGEAINKLVAARLASDVCGVPTILIARTDARDATLLSSNSDERDRAFITGKVTSEGFFPIRNGLEATVARSVAYAPFADMVWYETAEPDLEEARRFAEGVLSKYPGKLLTYNCSPSFNWSKKLDQSTIAKFQRELGAYGFKFQFVTLAGFHSINLSMFELARGIAMEGMSAYAKFQETEFEMEQYGYRAVKHQAFVGTGYFDRVALTIHGEGLATAALKGSTEEQQFHEKVKGSTL